MLLEVSDMKLSKNEMQIKLPSLEKQEMIISNKNSVVLIGANGSGKTRMSVWIEDNNQNLTVHRVAAQKSLNMPPLTRPSDMNNSLESFLFGGSGGSKEWLKNAGKKNYRWGNRPATHLLNDFSQLMEFLVTEEYEKSLIYRQEHKTGNNSFDNVTKLEIIRKIWEDVIQNKVLHINAGRIEVSNKSSSNELFNGAEMSDGERAIFYFIGEVLCVPDNSLIIIDEPENHLHKSILVRLWNEIEAARPDCIFLYVTHSLDFAVSRNNSQIIWVKDMPSKDEWEYELLSENDSRIDDVKLEILGNRQKVLLVEGDSQNSIDNKLYSAIFKDYNVISVESCNKVIEITKAYKDRHLQDKHYCEVKGIVDRDRRSNNEIEKLKQDNIFCPEVAEVENLFLLPEVIQVVAKKINIKEEDIEKILKEVKDKTFDYLENNIDKQALLFTRARVKDKINIIVNKKTDSIEQYRNNINSILDIIDLENEHYQSIEELKNIIENKDYYKALEKINDKGLFNHNGLKEIFGWDKKHYIEYILIWANASDVSEELCNIFKNYVRID